MSVLVRLFTDCCSVTPVILSLIQAAVGLLAAVVGPPAAAAADLPAAAVGLPAAAVAGLPAAVVGLPAAAAAGLPAAVVGPPVHPMELCLSTASDIALQTSVFRNCRPALSPPRSAHRTSPGPAQSHPRFPALQNR